jgi:fructosamine-3-kinase
VTVTDTRVAAAIESAVGRRVEIRRRTPLSGGSINRTERLDPWTDRWVEFYAESRLGFQARLARDTGRLSSRESAALDRLISKLGDWIDEPADGPALIHGDLWSGNVHVAADGAPALIDPAAYYAHREAELGMMTLFGGFSSRVFEAYDDAFPLEPGWQQRNALYQLYHLLNHLNLFGEGYKSSVMTLVLGF